MSKKTQEESDLGQQVLQDFYVDAFTQLAQPATTGTGCSNVVSVSSSSPSTTTTPRCTEIIIQG